MSKVVKGIGKAVGGTAKGLGKLTKSVAFGGLNLLPKGVRKKLGGAASSLAPLVGLIPGVGTLAGGALGAGGNLLAGNSLGDIIKGGIKGGAGAFGLSKLGGASGIAGKLGGLFKGGGAAGGVAGGLSKLAGGGSPLDALSGVARGVVGGGQQQVGGPRLPDFSNIPQMLQQGQQQGVAGQQVGGQQVGGQQQQGQQQGGGLMGFIGNLLGGGSTGANVGRLGALGLGGLELIGAGKARRSQEQFLQDILNKQDVGLESAKQSFAARGPLREAAFSRLESGLNRKAQGIFGR